MPARGAVTVRVVEMISARGGAAVDEPDPRDLMARLTQAYLSGDGAEVERIMALLATPDRSAPDGDA